MLNSKLFSYFLTAEPILSLAFQTWFRAVGRVTINLSVLALMCQSILMSVGGDRMSFASLRT